MEVKDEVLYELTNPLKQGIPLQVDTGEPAKGHEHRSLPAGASTDVYGWQMTDQILSLLRTHRGRGPVLTCGEVDLAARKAVEDKAAKEREVQAVRSMELKNKLREQKQAENDKKVKRAALIADHLKRQDEAKKPALTLVDSLDEPSSTKSKSSSKKKGRRDSVELSKAEQDALKNGDPLP